MLIAPQDIFFVWNFSIFTLCQYYLLQFHFPCKAQNPSNSRLRVFYSVKTLLYPDALLKLKYTTIQCKLRRVSKKLLWIS